MNTVEHIERYNDLLYRMSVEFLTERLGINPSFQELVKFVAHLRELNHQHAKVKFDNLFHFENEEF